MRELNDAIRWVQHGTDLCAQVLAATDDGRFAEPSQLPGWTVAHVVGHLALNAAALGNLVTWARTGVETPMYASAGQRDADIASQATKPPSELRQRYAESATRFSESLAELTAEQWQATVRTRAGRELPAAEIPWLRAREVMVHSIDLGGRIGFSDLPGDFLSALIDDVVAYRSGAADQPAVELMARNTGEGWVIQGSGTPVRVMAQLSDLAAWLTGRAATEPRVIGAGIPPKLPAWL